MRGTSHSANPKIVDYTWGEFMHENSWRTQWEAVDPDHNTELSVRVARRHGSGSARGMWPRVMGKIE